MKLLIAIPTHDYVYSDFMKCLMKLILKLKDDGIRFDVDILTGTLIYSARNKLARRAVNEGYTHVLWLDSDMIFNEDLLDDLMFSGKQFVSGIYHTRRPPHGSCIFKDIRLDSITKYMGNDYPKDTFEIAGCGFGCVLIDTQIIKDVFMQFGDAFCPVVGLGEDIAFCDRVSKCGYKMYCEPAVRLGHVGHIAIYPEDHEKWFVNNNLNEVFNNAGQG